MNTVLIYLLSVMVHNCHGYQVTLCDGDPSVVFNDTIPLLTLTCIPSGFKFVHMFWEVVREGKPVTKVRCVISSESCSKYSDNANKYEVSATQRSSTLTVRQNNKHSILGTVKCGSVGGTGNVPACEVLAGPKGIAQPSTLQTSQTTTYTTPTKPTSSTTTITIPTTTTTTTNAPTTTITTTTPTTTTTTQKPTSKTTTTTSTPTTTLNEVIKTTSHKTAKPPTALTTNGVNTPAPNNADTDEISDDDDDKGLPIPIIAGGAGAGLVVIIIIVVIVLKKCRGTSTDSKNVNKPHEDFERDDNFSFDSPHAKPFATAPPPSTNQHAPKPRDRSAMGMITEENETSFGYSTIPLSSPAHAGGVGRSQMTVANEYSTPFRNSVNRALTTGLLPGPMYSAPDDSVETTFSTHPQHPPASPIIGRAAYPTDEYAVVDKSRLKQKN